MSDHESDSTPAGPVNVAIGTRSPDGTRYWDGTTWVLLQTVPPVVAQSAQTPAAQTPAPTTPHPILPVGTRSPDGARFWDGHGWRQVGPDSPAPPEALPATPQAAPTLAVGTRSPDGARYWDGARWHRVGADSPAAPSTAQMPALARPQIRIGRRGKIGAAALVVVVLVGIAGNIVLNNITSPEAVAADYISAVGSNNADGIWSDSTLATSGATSDLGPAAYTLATRDELKAMLSLPENRHSSRDSIKVNKVADDGAGHVGVSAQYNEGGHATSESLTLVRDTNDKRFGLYPYWRVMVPPGYLSFSGAPDGAVLSIDGIGIPAGTTTVATFPGTHQVTAGATSIFAADTEKVTVAEGQSAPGR